MSTCPTCGTFGHLSESGEWCPQVPVIDGNVLPRAKKTSLTIDYSKFALGRAYPPNCGGNGKVQNNEDLR